MRPRCYFNTCWPFDESGCLGLQPKTGGRSHPKLNISGRPIAKKYRDGKVKRTLKRRSKVLETVKRETNGTSNRAWTIQLIDSKGLIGHGGERHGVLRFGGVGILTLSLHWSTSDRGDGKRLREGGQDTFWYQVVIALCLYVLLA